MRKDRAGAASGLLALGNGADGGGGRPLEGAEWERSHGGEAALGIAVSGKPNSLRSIVSGACGNSGWEPARRRMGAAEKRVPPLRRRTPP